MAKKTDTETEMTIDVNDTSNASAVLNTEGQATEGQTPDSNANSTDPAAPVSKRRRLEKEVDYENAVVKIAVIGGEKGEMVYNFSDLPADIKAKLGPFGLSHKLGDAAAGKSGTEAEEAIIKTFEALMESNWATRISNGPSIPTKKELTERVGALPDSEREEVMALLAKLGVKI